MRSFRAFRTGPIITGYRTFHAYPPHRNIDLIQATSDLVQGLHTTTHLPWALTLPLTAILVRLTIVLPMTLYTRRSQQRQLDLQPILRAWLPQIRARIMREKGHFGPVIVMRSEAAAVRAKRKELYKRWNCGWWSNYLPILQLPVFLLGMESIRALSGSSKGLLGLMWGGSESIDTGNANGIEAGAEGENGLGSVLPASGGTEMATIPLLPPTTDPTMATEGALWFPDLTASDPMLLLPFVLSATILLNIFSNTKRAGAGQTLWQKRVLRASGLLALAIGPLTLNFPSAMLLYWISGSMAAYAQSKALDTFMPLRLPPPPCKLKLKKSMG